MDPTGLVVRFPTNRPLTEQERAHQLHQKRRLNVKPRYQLSVIRMNSTYLESVDKWFGWKGTISVCATALCLVFTLTFGHTALLFLLEAASILPSTEDRGVLLANGLGMASIIGLIVWFCIWLLRKECFAYTHYPIRFDGGIAWYMSGARTVPCCRCHGMTFFFSLFRLSGEWEVRGHVLAADRDTVVESFALSHHDVMQHQDLDPAATQYSDQDFVRSHWEFIRRYMEEGPNTVIDPVQFCIPVDGRRESAIFGMHRVFANFSGHSWVMIAMVAPICLTIALFRIFAMRTSKIPRWPQEVEAACVIDEGDPYAIVGDAEGNRLFVYPEAAPAAVGTVSGTPGPSA